MSIWDELFAGTEVKDGVASAIRSSITEGQAHMLTKGLATENRWALFKLGYTGAEVGGFWAHRTDGQIKALIDWVNDFGDAQMCNAEITRRKRESNFTAKQLFEDLVDTAAAPQFGGDAATDPRLDRERRESLELRARVDAAVHARILPVRPAAVGGARDLNHADAVQVVFPQHFFRSGEHTSELQSH